MKEGEVHKGALQNGELVEGEVVDSKGGNERRGYNTASNQKCPELTPSKAVQRTELAEKIDRSIYRRPEEDVRGDIGIWMADNGKLQKL